MLDRNTSLLMVTDIQGRLASLMDERESLYRNAAMLIDGIRILGIPILWIEQYPQGLGPTIPEIASHLEGLSPLPKKAFSVLREPAIRDAFESLDRRQVILTGIETHICICQSSLDLLARGAEVHVPVDAVSSRTASNRRIGLHRIDRAGGHLTSVESVLFELLGVAGGEEFKRIVQLVK
jgi:nicotinamidase-related amidase